MTYAVVYGKCTMWIDVYCLYYRTGGGNGVFFTRRQLDETVAGFSNSSTEFIRNLLSLLTWEIFAGSSAFGSDTNPPPDSEIVSAYIGKFIMLLVLAFSSKYTLAAFQNLDFACS